ncbi:phage major capsid protein [Sphingomonas sanguinis]|uniref:phage major capsid protein n=1 Tax=Sphingomonas sp. LC-1 TaxID=3110957 RepID=UPI0021BB6039|nr:phage major capsid protein [Sphingomonas sp. LC-1]MCT8003290.1 phage major capsid protein [Sphingomonas sp. LC-1]
MKKRSFFASAAILGPMTAIERSRGRYMRGPEGHSGTGGKSAAELAEETKTYLDNRFFAIEQKIARGELHGGAEAPLTWGGEFVEAKSEDIAALVKSRGRLGMEVKATISTQTGSGGGLIVPTRDQTLMMPQRRLTVRNLMTTIEVSSNSVEYARQTARPTGADTVAELALKPESAIAFDLTTAPIRTIAHWIPASLQVLDDAPQLRDMIDTELLYGVALKEEQQLLNGSGTGQNLTGMVTAATAFDPAVLTALGFTSPNRIDRIGAAIYQAALTDVPPDGIVLHPSDWWAMRLAKDGQGKYILGDPGVDVTPVLFGLPVVPTQAQAAGRFLVGSFKSQTVYDRWAPRVEVSTEHADFFVRNMCAIRAEERIGSAIKRPEALITGTFA